MRGPEGRLSSMAESDLSSTLPSLSVRVIVPSARPPCMINQTLSVPDVSTVFMRCMGELLTTHGE